MTDEQHTTLAGYLRQLVDQLAEQWSENSACQFAREAHLRKTEICVQRLARIIAPFLPLPPQPLTG